MKICSVCKIEKELDEFYLRKESKDGYRANCKECVKVTTTKYKKNNPEKIKNAQKEWVLNNPEKRKKIQDKYNQKKERQEQKKIGQKITEKKVICGLIINTRMIFYLT